MPISAKGWRVKRAMSTEAEEGIGQLWGKKKGIPNGGFDGIAKVW